ncbi:MAG TPA: hypothetical protein ENJ08_05220 [Gammaproteobacteria bacterium]|nr:hypothetical protein [Gammaproteobacteria bacterium]
MVVNARKQAAGSAKIPPANTAYGKLIAYEMDVTGNEKVNDAYNLHLYQNINSNYTLLLHMDLQWFFDTIKDYTNRKGEKVEIDVPPWTLIEKKEYVKKWEKLIRAHWDNYKINIKTKNGKTITLKLSFQMQIEGWLYDNWEITVYKAAAKNAFRFDSRTRYRSRVIPSACANPLKNNVLLSKQDLRYIRIHYRGTETEYNTAVHEFSHFMGLEDEYPVEGGGRVGPYNKDLHSIVNMGLKIRDRHVKFLADWVNKQLT